MWMVVWCISGDFDFVFNFLFIFDIRNRISVVVFKWGINSVYCVNVWYVNKRWCCILWFIDIDIEYCCMMNFGKKI